MAYNSDICSACTALATPADVKVTEILRKYRLENVQDCLRLCFYTGSAMLYVLKSMCSSDLHAGPCVSDLKTMADKLEAQMMLNKLGVEATGRKQIV